MAATPPFSKAQCVVWQLGRGIRQSTSATHSFRRRSRSPPDAFSVARAGTLCIDYEAQFYAELRAYHDANYAWILVHEILRCPPDATGILDALLYDLNSVGASPPPEVPAHPRPDDVEQAFDLRIFWETPRMAAVTSEFKPDSMKKLQGKIEAFRSTSPYSPPFLIGYKHGDGIPHFRPELAAFL
ncbi:hypothetical protein BOTBODRAFT_37024 [Botryobasidium botryosum FD-172 SS1]|uniref:Uncharacterized protein n=1 Tax=Botryobasidium botryosum (strain FD-172 SS1) TaxID=930990 RepID=A0A067M1L7_BOTB1|nr:hypothetical protein BOTBODRAFT_37024 [Botryobasidium botryosum FD-172 SS1]